MDLLDRPNVFSDFVLNVVLNVVQVEAAVKSAEESVGPVDLLVTCAGVYRDTGTPLTIVSWGASCPCLLQCGAFQFA